MTKDTTMNKLIEMRLSTMAENYLLQLCDPSMKDISFEDRFSLLVDLEWSKRRSNKLTRLIKKSDLKFSQACVEDIEYHSDRELDKTLISRLATCNY